MQFEHVYLKINGVDYDDFTLFTDANVYNVRRRGKTVSSSECSFIVDNKRKKELESDKTFTPIGGSIPKGSAIYITPNCPYASDTIRSYYTVKRTPDIGDYNVIAPLNNGYLYHMYYSTIIVSPSYHMAFATSSACTTYEECERFVGASNLEAATSSLIYSSYGELYFYNAPPVYKSFLDCTLTKPVYPMSALDVNTGEPVTMDLLKILYNIGKMTYSEDNIKKFVLQLNIISQYDYQKYSGTLSVLLYHALNNSTIVNHILDHRSSQTKPVKNVLSCCSRWFEKFSCEEDFMLARQFVAELLGIGQIKFANFDSVCDKMNSSGIGRYVFGMLFNQVVKITPKEYEEKS